MSPLYNPYTDAKAIAAVRSNAETLAALVEGGNLLYLLTNAGWSSTVTGGGVVTRNLSSLILYTSTTTNSSALVAGEACFLGQGQAGMWWKPYWDRKLHIIFRVMPYHTDAAGVRRVQLKETTAIGALTGSGIGVRFDNLALVGESYGTELGEVDLATTFTAGLDKQIAIIHYPGSKIEWYVNGVLKGTQSIAAKIPSGAGAATANFVASVINGTSTTSIRIDISLVRIWQAES